MSSTSGSDQRSTGRTVLAVILGIIAVVALVAAIMYLALPAKSLSVLPGHIAGSTGHHPLRATGSFVVGHRFRGRRLVRPVLQAQAAGAGRQ